MRLAKNVLNQIIKEEITKLLSEESENITATSQQSVLPIDKAIEEFEKGYTFTPDSDNALFDYDQEIQPLLSSMEATKFEKIIEKGLMNKYIEIYSDVVNIINNKNKIMDLLFCPPFANAPNPLLRFLF